MLPSTEVPYECPKCGSENVEWGEEETMDGDCIIRQNQCNTCGFKFDETYRFEKWEVNE